MAQVDVVGEVMDVIEVVTDKQLHKVGDEVTWQVTKEVRDMVTGGGVVFSVGVHYWGRVHYPKAYNPAYASSKLCKFFHRGSNVIRVRMTISGCFEELGWFMWNLLPWITSHSGRHKILFLPNHPFFRQRHHRNPFEQSSSTSL